MHGFISFMHLWQLVHLVSSVAQVHAAQFGADLSEQFVHNLVHLVPRFKYSYFSDCGTRLAAALRLGQRLGTVSCDDRSCQVVLSERQKLVLSPMWHGSSLLEPSSLDVATIFETTPFSEYQARALLRAAEKGIKQHRLVLLVSAQRVLVTTRLRCLRYIHFLHFLHSPPS